MLETHQCCLKHGVNCFVCDSSRGHSREVRFKRFASRVYRCGQVIEASVPSDESERKMTRTFKREGARFVPGESDDDEEEDGA